MERSNDKNANLTELTKQIWRLYITGTLDDVQKALDIFDPACVVIGTGAHEYYTELNSFLSALEGEVAERGNVPFQIRNCWCQEQRLSDDVRSLYGAVEIWWEDVDSGVHVDMSSRFNMIFVWKDAQWKILFMHQSMPNQEQGEGEYFPQTMAAQVQNANEMINQLTDLAAHDSLTGLVNYRAFQKQWADWETGWVMILDLDDFKKINDMHGHMVGNQALQRTAEILRGVAQGPSLPCRMGGDEFLLLTRENGEAVAARLLDAICKETSPCELSLSIGLTEKRPGEAAEEAVDRADQALYLAKQAGKNQYRLYTK